MSRVHRVAAVGLMVLCGLVVGPLTASASEVVFVSKATEADAAFTSDSNGVTTAIEVISTTIIEMQKGAPVRIDNTMIFVTITDDGTGQQLDFLAGRALTGPSVASDIRGATFGPASIDLESNFLGGAPQTINLGVVWSPSGAVQHDHMLNFFCPPGVCFGMFNIVGTNQPATATLTVSGTVDGLDLSLASFAETSAHIQRTTGVGVFK